MADSAPDTEGDFTVSEDFVQSPTHKAAVTTTIDFNGLLQPGIKLHQNLAAGNGGQAWPAGIVLAKYLLRKKRDELFHSSIVELGSGSGLVGLAIAVGCRSLVHITDQEPMLALMQQNIALNSLENRVAASVFNWGQPDLPPVPAHPDVLLAADCVYFEPSFPLLQQTLQDLIGPRTVCYFCIKKRRRADSHFTKAIKKQFTVESVDDDPDREAYERENIFLYAAPAKSQR